MLKQIISLKIFFIISITVLYSKPLFVTTNFPLASIIKELTGDKADVISLVPSGASPHTFAPIPSDVVKVQSASAFFFVSTELDGWAANLPAKNKIKVMDILPKEFHQYFGDEHNQSSLQNPNNAGKAEDPHFWTDPMTVKALIPNLTTILIKLDKYNARTYIANAQVFDKKLQLLNWNIKKILKSLQGKKVFLFHPSFLYFLKRYDLSFGGVVEVDPGVEPSSHHTYELIKNIKKSGVNVIFSEPQLSESSALVIAGAADVKLDILDPLGGTRGRENYFDLIMYNVNIFQKDLK